jgi:hypothetical protein
LDERERERERGAGEDAGEERRRVRTAAAADNLTQQRRIPNRGAQTAFILFSTFLDLRPVSAAHDVQTSINCRLKIRISKSKTPI